jgi:ATP-dependent 26S proteasome regulatory subunit
LIERVNVKTVKEPPVVISDQQRAVLGEFLSVAKSHAQLESAGIHTSLTLLLYGPPGTGKSRIARHIAKELGLELFVARLDGLISSYLGSTSKNIRALFDFAAKQPCVLFLDEFDAIAKLRGDSQELGELKRVVNSFIQNLDMIGQHSIVLAATNHQELLDSAIWRRFGYRLALDFPSADLRAAMWEQFLDPLHFSKRQVALLVDLSEGAAGGDIQEVALRLHRQRITTRREPTLANAFLVLQNISLGDGEGRRFLAGFRGQAPPWIAGALRKRNPRLYSHAAIAELLGVSKATAYRKAQVQSPKVRNRAR